MVALQFPGNVISRTHSQYTSRYMTISCSIIIRWVVVCVNCVLQWVLWCVLQWLLQCASQRVCSLYPVACVAACVVVCMQCVLHCVLYCVYGVCCSVRCCACALLCWSVCSSVCSGVCSGVCCSVRCSVCCRVCYSVCIAVCVFKCVGTFHVCITCIGVGIRGHTKWPTYFRWSKTDICRVRT